MTTPEVCTEAFKRFGCHRIENRGTSSRKIFSSVQVSQYTTVHQDSRDTAAKPESEGLTDGDRAQLPAGESNSHVPCCHNPVARS